MSAIVYRVNKGINQSIEFKGLKAQYIWYLGGGILLLLVLFAALYILGIPSLVCVGFTVVAGTLLVVQVYRLSRTYGQYGLMKKLARRRMPRSVSFQSRAFFLSYKPDQNPTSHGKTF